MNTENSAQLNEEQIDKLVIAEANNEAAWEEPIKVSVSQKAISLLPELAKRKRSTWFKISKSGMVQ